MGNLNEEWIAARKEYNEAQEEERRYEERFSAVTVNPGPDNPMRRSEAMPVTVVEDTVRIKKRVSEARARYDAAAKALRDSRG